MAEEVLVHLTAQERSALRRERDIPFSEKGMFVVIATVSLAALLQGTSYDGLLAEWLRNTSLNQVKALSNHLSTAPQCINMSLD